MLHLENFFEKSFALLLTTPKYNNRSKISLVQRLYLCYDVLDKNEKS